MRGEGLGTTFIDMALKEASSNDSYNTIRLVTLGNHSEGRPVMGAARRLYERRGFQAVQKDTIKFGDSTSVDIMYYEKQKI